MQLPNYSGSTPPANRPYEQPAADLPPALYMAPEAPRNFALPSGPDGYADRVDRGSWGTGNPTQVHHEPMPLSVRPSSSVLVNVLAGLGNERRGARVVERVGPSVPWHIARIVGYTGGLAAAAAITVENLPEGTRNLIHRGWEAFAEDGNLWRLGIGTALGSLAALRAVRSLPNGVRDALGGAPGTPLRPAMTRGWFRDAVAEARDPLNTRMQKVGGFLGNVVIGAVTLVPGMAAALPRRLIRRPNP